MDGFALPVTVDRLTVLAVLLCILAAAVVLTGVVAIFAQHRVPFATFGNGLVLLVLGVIVFAAAGWAQTYRSLTHNQLVATVRAVPVPGKAQTMQVVYTPITDGKSEQARVFTVAGDEWQLSGNVITWQDWLNILGVGTGYRITQLSGYYENANDYGTKPVTTFDLNASGDSVSRFQRDHPNLMPFVHVTGGNGLRMLPGAATYQVYLSPTGYWAAQI